jgi:hypothetical protein
MNCPMEHTNPGHTKSGRLSQIFQKPSRCAAAAGAVGHAQALARQQVVVILRKIVGPLPLVASTLVPARCLYPTPTHRDTRNCPRPAQFLSRCPVQGRVRNPAFKDENSYRYFPHVSEKRPTEDMPSRCARHNHLSRASSVLGPSSLHAKAHENDEIPGRSVACGNMACACAWRHHQPLLQCRPK